MTKVKCDVQIVVTGPTASGKTLIANRILTAIQSYADLSAICKVFPTRSFEGICQDVIGLRFEGELPQVTIAEDSVANPIEVFFFHDIEDGWYHAKLPNGESINHNNWKELKYSCECRVPMATFEWSKDNPKAMDLYRPAELAKPERAPHSDDSAKPVGSHQQSENAAPTMDSGPSGGCVQVGSGVEQIYTKEMKKFERLPGESNSAYHQRYRDHIAAKDAERNSRDKAFETLQAVVKSIPAQFYPHSLIKNSMLRGDYWVIFSDGSLVPVYHFMYTPEEGKPEPVYYAERETRQDDASPAKDAHISCSSFLNLKGASDASVETLLTFREKDQLAFHRNMNTGWPTGLGSAALLQAIGDNGKLYQVAACDINWKCSAIEFYRVI